MLTLVRLGDLVTQCVRDGKPGATVGNIIALNQYTFRTLFQTSIKNHPFDHRSHHYPVRLGQTGRVHIEHRRKFAFLTPA